MLQRCKGPGKASESRKASTHPKNGLAGRPLIRKCTSHVGRLCCTRAPRAVLQRVPLGRASVTSPWLRPSTFLIPLLHKEDNQTRTGGQGHLTAEQDSETNLRKTDLPKGHIREGQGAQGGPECMWSWDIAAL